MSEAIDSDSLADANAHERVAIGFLLMTIMLALSMSISMVVERMDIRALGSAAIATTLGLLLGLVLYFDQEKTLLEGVLEMNDSIFFYLLLPPIIFEGGFALQRRVFLKNIGTTLWMACFATFVTFLFLASGMFLAGKLGFCSEWTFEECLGFAAVVSATDPVTVLSILKKFLEGTGDSGLELLFMLVSGEALLNDAICLVLYKSLITLHSTNMPATLMEFLRVFSWSCALGILVAMLSAFSFKYLQIAKEDGSSAVLEVAVMVLFVWMSYLLPEALELSGICAILFCGIFMHKYLEPNLSESGKHLSHGVFSLFASMAESTTFVFLGIAPFSFHAALGSTGIFTYLTVLLLAVGSRLFSVQLTILTANMFRHDNKIPENYVSVLQLCGFRGSMALALGIRARADFPEHGSQILATTIILGLFTVLGLGGAVPQLLGGLLKDAPKLPELNDKDVTRGFGGLMKKALVKMNEKMFENTLTMTGRKEKGHTFNDAASLFKGSTPPVPIGKDSGAGTPAVVAAATKNPAKPAALTTSAPANASVFTIGNDEDQAAP
jgi:solute carrier family 9 (sodium/hydrogen exchanger), member 8